MKLLMIFADKFSYTPTVKSFKDAETHTESKTFEKAVIGFIQVEAQDAEKDLLKVEKIWQKI